MNTSQIGTEEAATALDIIHGELLEALVRDKVIFASDGIFHPYKKHVDNGRFTVDESKPGQLFLTGEGFGWLTGYKGELSHS